MRKDGIFLVPSSASAGGLESRGFLMFAHHWAWHCDAGVTQDEENPLR